MEYWGIGTPTVLVCHICQILHEMYLACVSGDKNESCPLLNDPRSRIQ